jgi:large subunit ribosomal protein L4
MLIDFYNKDGQVAGKYEMPDSVFAIEPNEQAMHQAVVVYLAHQRQGNAKTKVRNEVSGGGKKPWKQKGRGTARSGSTRSPLWVGGGTVHGPKPHLYTIKLPKKVNQLARKSALSIRLSEQNIVVVDDFNFDSIKTKQMADVLKNLKIAGEKTLLLLPATIQNVYMSARNIDRLSIMHADKVSAYDILNHKKILMFKGSVDKLANIFN